MGDKSTTTTQKATANLFSMNTLSTLESKSDVVKGLRTRDSGVDSDFSNSKSPEYEKKNDLAAKLKRLVQKRDNLKKRLENESKRKNVADVIVEQAAQQPKSFEKESVYNEEALIQSTQQRQSRDLKLAYRLTGCSLSLIEDKVIRLVFDTSYKGEYFESYYADLTQTESEKEHVLTRYTFPPFFPRVTLEACLKNSILSFVHAAQGLLQAYITRRQEIIQMESFYKEIILGEVETTLACDYLTFCLRETGTLGCPVKVVLTYKDFTSVLPDSVEARIPKKVDLGADEAKAVLDIVNDMAGILKKTLLNDALEKIME